jgi:glutathione S-transferase
VAQEPQVTSDTTDAPTLRLHGLKLSYFTGKLEGYLRVKGIPYDFIEMDTRGFRHCARESGVLQMPQIESADGRWLTDTTSIIDYFEQLQPSPAIRPSAPAVAFASLLLEDLFDEWLWRPALYYRWAFEEDSRLMSAQIARTMMRDVPAPFWLRRRLILARQRNVYLRNDGVTPATSRQIETLYLDSLDALEPIFRARPFLLGARPCEADFGLFGPMFRHFFSDPTPAAIMRERAPAVAHWVTRLWATRPEDIRDATPISALPDDLAPFWTMAAQHYLPYLAANAAAVAAHRTIVSYAIDGLAWRVPASPYRAHCLIALQQRFGKLPPEDQTTLYRLLGQGASILAAAPRALASRPGGHNRSPLDRHWKARLRS